MLSTYDHNYKGKNLLRIFELNSNIFNLKDQYKEQNIFRFIIIVIYTKNFWFAKKSET